MLIQVNFSAKPSSSFGLCVGRSCKWPRRPTVGDLKLSKRIFRHIQGDPSARGLGYVDINSVSFGGYPETDLSQHNPVHEQMGHPAQGDKSKR